MADATTKRWIYPPNMQTIPNWPRDAEGGESGHQGGGYRRYILHLTNISDGTGESDVEKLAIADLRGPTGKKCVRTVIEWIEYDVFGMDVTLYWLREGVSTVIARIPGGANIISGKIRGPLYDPGTGDGTDGTGNITLTTSNAASGDSYDLRLCIRPKEYPKPRMNPEDQVDNLFHQTDTTLAGGKRK